MSYRLCIIALELLIRRGESQFVIWGLPLLIWGYGQYRFSRNYRTAHGGGGPGIDNLLQRIVATGIYRYTRNPIYLGHLIFMLRLALTFYVVSALPLLASSAFWFQRRVVEDEACLECLFGAR